MEAAPGKPGAVFSKEKEMRGDIHSIWYSSVLKEDYSLWCESSNPEEVIRMSEGKDVIFRKLVVYYDHDGWELWDANTTI